MTNFHFGKPEKNKIIDIINCFNLKDINSAKTSTLPLIDYWKKTQDRLAFYNNNLNVEIENPDLCFEYPCESYQNNNPSYTDLVIQNKKLSVFIESKYKETLYSTIGKWYDKSDNKKNVLLHWLTRINDYLKKPISIDEILEFDYQMLHRISSACLPKEERAIIIYQVNCDQEYNHLNIYFNELEKFSKIFMKKGVAKKITLCLHKVTVELIYPDIEFNEIIKTIRKKRLFKIISEEFINIYDTSDNSNTALN